MKKLLMIPLLFVFAVAAQAQKDVTKFLGIPVDGTKTAMINELKAKGYTLVKGETDILEGEFNGRDVHIFVQTNNNKVYRLMVCDANSISETDIKIRFNNLCRQFEKNKKYVSLSENQTIPDDEDISYEIIVKKKRYEAVFYQKPVEGVEIDENGYYKNSDLIEKKTVWFMIGEEYGQYFILMYYDNIYNQSDGDDL